MIKPIKPNRLANIVRTVVRKSSNLLKLCWLKVICFICQSNELERDRGPAKNQGGHGPPRPPPLEPPLEVNRTFNSNWASPTASANHTVL